MTEQIPEFETDDEIESWFDNADLGFDELEPVLEIEISESIEIILDQPWAANVGQSVSASSGVIESRVTSAA